MTRLLHVGLGPLGRRVLEEFGARRLGEIVAVVDLAPELVGRPLGEFVPGAPEGVRISADLAAAAALDVDTCLVTTGSDLAACAETFRVLLRAGHTVVSSCEELLWPRLRHAALAEDLDRAARRHGGRLLGTGVNPGFLMDTLPIVVSSVCSRVERITIERIQDAAPRRLPFQKKIGAGLDPASFAELVRKGTVRHVGLPESLHFVAHHLGLPLAAWDETLEPVLAERPLSCAAGAIEVGQVAGVRQVAEGRNEHGEPLVRMIFQAAIGQVEPHDGVRIEGDPPLELILPGGVHGDVATSAILLNTIAPLRASPPGLHTMATIPPAPCRRPVRGR